MRPLVRHRRNQRGLPVVPAAPPDARPAAPPRCRGRRRRRAARPPSRRPSASVTSTPARRRRLARRPRLDGRCATSGAASIAARSAAAQVAVLEDVAHRPLVDLLAVEVQEEPRRSLARPAVADLDLVDRLRPGREPAPRARAPPAAAASRARAHRRGRRSPGSPAPRAAARIEHDARKPALRQRERQHRAVQPAADDQDVAIPFAMRAEYRPAQPIVQPRAARLGCAGKRRRGRMSDTWLWMTAATSAAASSRARSTPRELTETYLAAIDSHPEGRRHLRPHHARARPRRGRRRRRPRRGRPAPRPARRRAGQLEGPRRHRRHRHRGGLRAARRAGCPSATRRSSPPRPAPASSASARPT